MVARHCLLVALLISATQGTALAGAPPFKEAVVYQVYWRSFAKDARGLTARLDYIQRLGANVVWITPMYPSPLKDGGYDVSDFLDCDPSFGTIADFQILRDAAQARGIRIMLDMVFNHVSDQHPWFRAASDPWHHEHARYRDYFIWRKSSSQLPPDLEPAAFGGTRWRYVDTMQAWVYHSFTPEQIDLDWRNPLVRADILQVLQFWNRMGVDAFRFDVINMVDKAVDQPNLLGWLQSMRRAAFDSDQAITVGEMPGVSLQQAQAFTNPQNRAVDMVFSFDLPALPCGANKFETRPWSVGEFKEIFVRWQQSLNGVGWNSLYLGNHDWARSVSRWGDSGVYRERSAKLLATLQFAHQGTPFIYQGEELGLANTVYPRIEDYRDVESINYYQAAVLTGTPPDVALSRVQQNSRDASRGPMPWNEAEVQSRQSNSVFAHYAHLIALRQQQPAMIHGEFTALAATPADSSALEGAENVYTFTRSLDNATVLVILNISNRPTAILAPLPIFGAQLLSNNVPEQAPEGNILALQPYQALIYRLDDTL